MTQGAIAFVSVAVLTLIAVPRRLAVVPLLAGACYITLNQSIELGSLTFSVLRILIAAGVVRAVLRGEQLTGGVNTLDRSVIVWSMWTCVTSVFHVDPKGELIARLGMTYDACGMYFLCRAWCSTPRDVQRLCCWIVLVLAPVALAMLYEHVGLYNVFSVFGGAPETPMIRDGRLRAFGPFAHPILAGTVGAVCLPLAIGIWARHKSLSCLGVCVCLTMVFASGSSGPMLSSLGAIAAVVAWSGREYMWLLRRAAVAGYVGLEIVMKDPAYYIIARADVIGGGTGWHRAALIEASIRHLKEWWLVGTDYTRHWLPTGVSWSPNHTDITNHYLHIGVMGGLPLMVLFIVVLVKCFRIVGDSIRALETDSGFGFTTWCLGSAMFAQALTCLSVSYFDQSILFLYLTMAAIGSACQLKETSAHQIAAAERRPVRPAMWGHVVRPEGGLVRRSAALPPKSALATLRRGMSHR
jgi:hypothetical protein